ncbi:HNH endonuclease [Streptomyces mirabilis]|uniref:HNH endonuclease n=1 Tax=Streptomyces mirabilis TaxID=68239 RepID=UPI0021BEA059|nr:HNH endonuclease [Streptomyces mirabilis]MCT9107930.1 HNH endonuclease [Streptomyces mirabilis]
MTGRPRKTPEGSRTTRLGLGSEHQKQRARLLASLVPGEPCDVCGRPMYPEQDLDADHETPRALGGARAGRLLHASCNRRLGAQLGNRLRTGQVANAAAPPPRQGAPCYSCGRPMFAGQELRSGSRAGVAGESWSHARCGTRDYSVPADLL